jgi:hypothetical protein
MVTHCIERTVRIRRLRWTVAISIGLSGGAAHAGVSGGDDLVPAPPTPVASEDRDHDAIADRLTAARAFLAALTPDLRSRASASLSDPDRDRWSYLPGPRAGVRLEELDEAQRLAWQRFHASTLTAAGLARADRIRATEPVHDRGGGVFTGPDVYAIRFFGLDGDPAVTPKAWAWRFEGHHVRIGETIIGDRIVAATPFMLGSVRRRDAVGEVFELEDGTAARLLAGVPAERVAVAWSEGPMPGDVLTAMSPPKAWRLDGGVSLADAGEGARALANGIVEEVLAWRPPETIESVRQSWMATADADIRFAWVGDRDRTRTHQWRIVAPSLVIEFSHSGGDANHGHLVLRRPDGEFPEIDGEWRDAP